MNRTEVQEHVKESGQENILITIKGWLGSGKKGIVVLDNLNVTQRDEGSVTADNGLEGFIMETNNETSGRSDCLERRSAGDCAGQFTRYYYSLPGDACVQFRWSGCGGNKNNFLTEDECLDTCTGSHLLSGAGPHHDLNSPQLVCALEAQPGNCSQSVERFYFSVQAGDCQQFTFTGCHANQNNFHTLQACQQFCAPVMVTTTSTTSSTSTISISTTTSTSTPTTRSVNGPRSVCSLPSERGSCSDLEVRYHYVPEKEDCVIFQFSGCGVGRRVFGGV